MSDNRQRFQGLCLTSTEGYMWMQDSFDPLPFAIRERLRNSEFNLCAACVLQRSRALLDGKMSFEQALMKQIEKMEDQLRAASN